MAPQGFRRWGVAAVGGCVILLAACGQTAAPSTSAGAAGTTASTTASTSASSSASGSSTGSGSSAATSSATTASSGATVTIGLLAPMTGSRADLGKGMQEGAQLAIDDINAAGGVLGHQVQLVTQDTAADPADAVPAAQQEISVDHVAAIVGPTSITAGVVLPLAQQANIPDLMFGGGAIFDKNTNPYFFRLSPSDSEQSDAMAAYAHSKGWNTIALAFGASSGSQPLVAPLMDAAKAMGIKVVANVTFTAGQTSYRSEIAKLFANHPQAIISQFNDQTAGVVFGELGQMGLLSTPWIGSNLWYTNTFFKSVGAKVASGNVYIVNSSSTGMTAAPHFLSLLKSKLNLDTPPNGSEFMYDAVMVWALGADRAGTTQWPGLRTKGILLNAKTGGTVCGEYATCYGLIKQGKSIEWEGVASTDQFDQYDNVYGPFAIFHYKQDGSVTQLLNLTPQQIQAALSGS